MDTLLEHCPPSYYLAEKSTWEEGKAPLKNLTALRFISSKNICNPPYISRIVFRF